MEDFSNKLLRKSYRIDFGHSDDSIAKGKERFGIGPLMLEHKLLAYVVACIITLRGSNHAQLTEEDLLLINLMQGKMKIKWINILVYIMLKTKRIGSFKCPYAVLISRILDYFGVDTQEEVFGFVEAKFEVKTKVLKQMGYIKIEEDGIGWIEKNREDQTEQEEVEEKPMSPFEQMMLAKMDEHG
ncbi:hypothetical protein JHK85_025159 [Glycine max]|nr:hypothetical protein JHK85_025159 [Glycine max]KAG5012398.1 hypothetical protein JHK86_024659 [Glycine max]